MIIEPPKLDDRCPIHGLAISPGLAQGPAYVHRDILNRVLFQYTVPDDQLDDEWDRIQNAVDAIEQELDLSAARITRELGQEMAKIFEAHRLLLCDPVLHQEFERELHSRRVNAEDVVKAVLDRYEQKIRSVESGMLSERGDDIADLSRRLLRVLSGTPEHTITQCPRGSVLVARQLLPSECVHLKRLGIAAVVMERGGTTSHAALLTREMGVPAISGLPGIKKRIENGDTLLVDGNNGTLVLHADEKARINFLRRLDEQEKVTQKFQSRCHQPANTIDGATIGVMANVGCRSDVQQAVDNGADGVGLYRIEHHFLTRSSLPSEEELLSELTDALEPMANLEITIRLLDTGGDKRMPWLDLPYEPDPFLGRRGIRFLLAWPELLRTQLRVLLRLSTQAPINLLIPMVTTSDEVQRTRIELDRVAHEMKITAPRLGVMIETPAAALCANSVTQHADFVSIGSNDLTQYTMVAGRENPLVSEYFDDRHPAVMRLIEMVCSESRGLPVSVCGELAGDCSSTERLLGMGICTLSVAPPLIPKVKDTIRGIGVSQTSPTCK